MKIVIVSHVRVFPASAGNELRIQHMLKWLKNRLNAYIVYVYAPLPNDEQEFADYKEVIDELIVVKRQLIGCLTRTFEYKKIVHADEQCLETRVNELQNLFVSDELFVAMKKILVRHSPDVFMVQYVFMSRLLLLSEAKTCLRVIDLHDLYQTRREKICKFGIHDELAISPTAENYLINRSDIAICIQREEYKILRKGGLAAERLITVGFDVMLNRVDSGGDNSILFFASNNQANVLGINSFLKYCWPRVIEKFSCKLYIAGSISESIGGNHHNVEILGRVDDVDELFAKVDIAINPVFPGTGLKIKTLEALSFCKPVVCWPAGAEGLSEYNCAISVARDWLAFAAKIVMLLSNSNELARAKADCEEYVVRYLNADMVYGELLELFSKNNFFAH